jgi:hypothetical protein
MSELNRSKQVQIDGKVRCATRRVGPIFIYLFSIQLQSPESSLIDGPY